LPKPLSSLPSIPDYQIHQFSNGLRLIHKQVPGSKVVHCGYILDIGSRDEAPHHQGIAHFWEHMAFKGTQKRKAFHIINRLEVLGGELNAYTTKEKIAFHASVLASHFDKAVDLLTDITFFSIFPEKEIEKEKGVILEEMAMYQDTPDDAIQDDFDALLFSGHPLGNNILGTEESVKSFQQSDFQEFYSNNISFDRLIFSVVGPFSLEEAIKKSAPFMEPIQKMDKKIIRQAPPAFFTTTQEEKKPISQAHLMLGCRAFPLLHENRLLFFVLQNVLGGPAMTSRLNFTIREKYGLVYGVESNYAPYLDTGAFTIYLATEPKNLKKAEELVWKEIHLLADKNLSSKQLKNAKEQLKGQLAMAEEGNLMLMLMLGKSILDLGKVESLAEIFMEIDALEADQLREVARQSWSHDQWARLAFLPENGKKRK
jgi:predicted Zn-dependent peptidase